MNANSKDVPTVKLLIDGAFVESATNEWRDIVNPATQQVLARVPFATVAEVDAAVQAAHTAFATWKNTPIAARMRIMLKFQDLVRTNQQRIAKTLTAEQGKTIPDAEGDIFRGLEVVEHACSIGSLQLGEFAENVAGGVDTYTRAPTPSTSPPHLYQSTNTTNFTTTPTPEHQHHQLHHQALVF